MKAQYIKVKNTDGIPHIQDYLLTQSADKHWQCIKQGIELYLGYPMDEEDATLVEIHTYNETDKIMYNGAHIGTVVGAWIRTDHLMKYTWTFTLEP